MSERKTPLQSAVDAVLSVLASTEQMAHDDPDALRAINRAQSWLGNIMNPISKSEDEAWFKNCALEEAQYYLEDGRAKELARTAIEHGSTDEDKREELKDFRAVTEDDDA